MWSVEEVKQATWKHELSLTDLYGHRLSAIGYGSGDVARLGFEPAPAAARRLRESLWQPVASLDGRLIPSIHDPRLPRAAHVPGSPQGQKVVQITFTRGAGRRRTALMKTNPSFQEGGRLDNTPNWDVIQNCIITGWAGGRLPKLTSPSGATCL